MFVDRIEAKKKKLKRKKKDAGNGKADKSAAKKKRKIDKAANAAVEDVVEEEEVLDMTADLAAAAAGAQQEIDFSDGQAIWTVSHKRFLSDFRKQAIVEFTADRLDATAAAIVRVILNSYPVDINARVPAWEAGKILRLIEDDETAPVVDMDTLMDNLREMCHDTLVLARKEGSNYYINVTMIFEAMQLRHAQSVIKERFGVTAARIFRLLIINKRLEEKQVFDMATAPKKQARSMLYEMMRAGFVSLQGVPRTSDRKPASTLYLWGVPFRAAKVILADSILFAWVNLRTRLDLESTKIQPLLGKLEVDLDSVTPQEKDQIERWKKGADRMQHGLSQLVDLITLYMDLGRDASEAF